MPLLATFGAASARGFGAGGGVGWNPNAASAELALTNNNLLATKIVGGATFANVRGSIGHTSGKWAFEITVSNIGGVSPDDPQGGLADSTFAVTGGQPGADTHSIAYDRIGSVRFNGGSLGAADSYTTGAVLHYEVDITTGEVWVQKLGGTGRKGPFSMSGIGATVYPLGSTLTSGDALTVNLGTSAFSIAPTATFSAWG